MWTADISVTSYKYTMIMARDDSASIESSFLLGTTSISGYIVGLTLPFGAEQEAGI
jgi:hypothetical protein